MYANLHILNGQLSAKISELAETKRFFVVYDAVLSRLHSSKIDALLAAERCIGSFAIETSERDKTLAGVEAICHSMLQCAVNRDDFVIAVGGGVLTDMAGFAAAIYKRGVAWLVVPTTLIGMVDAAIGGKTAVNTTWAKNSLGSFHLPQAVVFDKSFLTTLPDAEWQNGRAECIKYCYLDERFKLADNMASLVDFKRYLADQIASFANYKQAIVARDLTDCGQRQILNFGHTFGHAYESAYSYRALRHGEAVMLGMAIALFLSHQLLGLDAAVVERYRNWLNEQSHFKSIDLLPFAQLSEYLVSDKKVRNGLVVMVLLEAIGKPRLFSIGVEQLASLYDKYYESNHH
ncbi:MAG: 3-dehydroquinate synthase [Clostridiales bacterium]|nr:MAG: 3-dehydroquinate synthase [Clostridiales bacterium]